MKKTANMSEYNKEYYQKNKEKLKEKKICEICGKTYALWNASHHFKSKFHIFAEQNKKIEDLIKNIEDLKSKK